MLDERLMEKIRSLFPRLYAEYPVEFGSFFDKKGAMNQIGHAAYDHLKKVRRMRIAHKNAKDRTS